MPTQTIIENQYAQLYYHADTCIVHHHVTEFTDDAHWRELLSTGTQVLKNNNAKKWLSDNRLMPSPHGEQETAWINNVWLPETIAAGWRYWALVVPDDWSSRNNLVDYVNYFFELGVRIMVFTDADEAMDWLIKVDQ